MTSSDPDSWPFAQPENMAVLVKRTVVARSEPIRIVTHEDDGTWTFLDGRAPTRDEDLMVVSLARVVEFDGSVAEVADLPPCAKATRSDTTDQWKRSFKFSPAWRARSSGA